MDRPAIYYFGGGGQAGYLISDVDPLLARLEEAEALLRRWRACEMSDALPDDTDAFLAGGQTGGTK